MLYKLEMRKRQVQTFLSLKLYKYTSIKVCVYSKVRINEHYHKT